MGHSTAQPKSPLCPLDPAISGSVFWGALGNDYLPMDELTESGIEETLNYEAVEIWKGNPRKPGDLALAIRDLLVRLEASPGDLAVIASSNAELEQMQRELARIHIPARLGPRGKALLRRVEIKDLAHLLASTADPTARLSLLAVLHSPFASLSLDSVVILSQLRPLWPALLTAELNDPDEQLLLQEFLVWFVPLIAKADRTAAWEILSDALAHSPYLVAAAADSEREQVTANVRKAQMLTTEYPNHTAGEMADLLFQVGDLTLDLPDAQTHNETDPIVTLSTIHSAKGLGWPITVVMMGDYSRGPKVRRWSIIRPQFG